MRFTQCRIDGPMNCGISVSSLVRKIIADAERTPPRMLRKQPGAAA
jgi:hypothetical protein